jgi:glyoxylase I family protein
MFISMIVNRSAGLTLRGAHHVAIICAQIESSKRFYIDALGLALVSETFRAERNSWKVNVALPDGVELELFTMPGAPARPSYPEAQGLRHLALSVADLDVAIDHLARFDIACEPIRVDGLTNQRFTFLADPDGLPIELYELAV